jgi:hypothetical protein
MATTYYRARYSFHDDDTIKEGVLAICTTAEEAEAEQGNERVFFVAASLEEALGKQLDFTIHGVEDAAPAVLSTAGQIDAYRLLTLRQMLKLEIKGLKRRGRSAYAILKDMGYTGTRQQVLQQLDKYREQVLQLEAN